LGAVQRRFAAKRSGLGGFVIGQSNSQKREMESKAEKYLDEEAQARERAQTRKDSPLMSAEEAIQRRSNVLQNKMLQERANEASYSNIPGGTTPIRQVDLDPAGIDSLAKAIEGALRSGDQATAVAGLQRMSQSQGGFDRAMQMRTQVMGGNDQQLVSDEHKTAWELGTANVKNSDAKKAPAFAYKDVSAEEFAGMSSKQAGRAIDYYSRNVNSSDPRVATAARSAMNDFNNAAQAAVESNTLRTKIQPETLKVVAQAAVQNPGVITPATYQRVNPLVATRNATASGVPSAPMPVGNLPSMRPGSGAPSGPSMPYTPGGQPPPPRP
jgi:hypothetical protein